jgi:hypothetical protein
MRKTAFFLLGALGLFGSLSAGVVEFGLGGGIFSHDWRSGGDFGVTAATSLVRWMFLEAEYFYYPSGSNNADYEPDGIQHHHRSLSNLGLHVLAGPNLTGDRRLVPYLALGLAIFRDIGGPRSQPLQLAAGGGLKLRASKVVGFRADFRYFLQIADDEYPAFRNLWRLTAGISFRL